MGVPHRCGRGAHLVPTCDRVSVPRNMWGCQKGDCLSPLQTSHVMDYRRKAALRAAQVEIKSSGGHDGAMMDLLDHEVRGLCGTATGSRQRASSSAST